MTQDESGVVQYNEAMDFMVPDQGRIELWYLKIL